MDVGIDVVNLPPLPGFGQMQDHLVLIYLGCDLLEETQWDIPRQLVSVLKELHEFLVHVLPDFCLLPPRQMISYEPDCGWVPTNDDPSHNSISASRR